MTEYNYTTGEFYAEGDFEAVGCGGIIKVLVIHKKDTPKPNLVDRLECKKSGSFETKLEMRDIKTILTEEFRSKGEWKPNCLMGEIPLGVDVNQIFNSRHLDNYIFIPEVLF
jgi:hypothetical protein